MVLVGGGYRHSGAGTWGRIMVLVVVGIDTQIGGDLGKDHGSGGHGDRRVQSWGPGKGSWFCW